MKLLTHNLSTNCYRLNCIELSPSLNLLHARSCYHKAVPPVFLSLYPTKDKATGATYSTTTRQPRTQDTTISPQTVQPLPPLVWTRRYLCSPSFPPPSTGKAQANKA